MPIGFVLIITAPQYEHEVYNELLEVSEIIEIHSLLGEYDLIAKFESKNMEKMSEIIINKIRTVQGVICTKTLTGAIF